MSATSEPQRAVDLGAMLTAGAKIGGGIGLASVIYDALRSRKRKEDAVAGGGDDEVLRLKLAPSKNQLRKTSALSEIVGGAAATVGSAYLVQKLYKMVREKQLKQERDEATEVYLQGLSELGNQKAANDDARGWDFGRFVQAIKEAPAEAFLLSGLVGTGATYATLANAFPKDKAKSPTKGKLPKKVVIDGYGTVHVDGTPDGPWTEKAAFEVGEDDYVKAAADLFVALTHVADSAGVESVLPHIGGLQLQHGGAFQKTAAEMQEKTLFDAEGREAWDAADPEQKFKAATEILASPATAPMAAAVMLAEVDDLDPTFSKIARYLVEDSPEDLHLLVKFSSLMRDFTLGNDSTARKPVSNDDTETGPKKKNVKDPIDALLTGSSL